MFNFAKRVTSAVVAGAVVLGTLAVSPNLFSGKDSSVVRAAEVPTVMDSSSAVNYSTILGRGVDYGIVAENFQQRDHMESTFAVINFSKIPFTVGTFSTIDLNPVGSTAQVLVDSVVTSGEVFGTAVAGPKYLMIEGNGTNLLNIEGSSQIYTSGYYQFQNFKKEVKTVNDNTDGNIKLIMNDAFTSSKEITNKFNNGYAINYSDYYTESSGTLNLTKGDFINKVVYIKVDNALMKKIGEADGFKIIKDSSTVIVFQIDDSVDLNAFDKKIDDGTPGRPIGKEGKSTQDYVLLNKYQVSVDGGNTWISSADYSGRYNIKEDDNEGKANLLKTQNCDREICQKVIWNITTTKPVAIENTSGLFIVPNTFIETHGTCAGWIVAKDFANSQGEWHYIYGGGSQEVLYDDKGEIHFASKKTFTHAWNGEKTLEDTTIYTKPGTYSFYWYENNSSFSITDPQYLSESQCQIIKNNATNKLQFPTLHFFSNEQEAIAAGQKDHYIPAGSEGVNFYYTVREVTNAAAPDGIKLSDGYINIFLTVKYNDSDNDGVFDFEYYVYTETHLGDENHTISERNFAIDDNGNPIMKNGNYTQTRMSGIEFYMGKFFNLAETSLELKKTVKGDYTPQSGEEFTYYVYNKAEKKYYYLDDKGNLASSTDKKGVTVKYGETVRLIGISVGDYTVSEDTYSATRRGYELNAPAPKDVKVALNSTPVVNLVNDYTRNADDIGKLVLTKTIKGPVTKDDLTGLKFTVTDETDGSVVWEHYLGDKEFTETPGKKYTATIENLNIKHSYTVTETLTSVEGYELASAKYKIGNNSEADGTRAANVTFGQQSDSVNVDFANEYARISGKLSVTKELQDETGKTINVTPVPEFKFNVAVKDLGYLQADGTVGKKAHEFTVKPGTPTEITVDYSAFNKELTVTETGTPSINGYSFSSSRVAVTSTNKSVNQKGATVSATIYNVYKQTPDLGTVVITKTISGAELADFEKIHFDVTIDGNAYGIPDLTTTNVGTSIGNDWIKADNNKYTFTIVDVPVNSVVKLTETSATLFGTAVSKYTKNTNTSVDSGETTVISATSTNEIVLKNNYDINKGSVVISKTISGAELADFETVHFDVTADGVAVNVPDLTTANVNNKKWTDEGNGKYTYTITDVPVNTVYEVTENLTSSVLKESAAKKYTLNSSSVTKGSVKVETADKEYSIDLTNDYDVNVGKVVISKTVSGAPLEEFETIHFDVTADGKAVTIPDLKSSNVGTVVGTDWIDQGKGVYTFTITDVPVGTKYVVKETVSSFLGTATKEYTFDKDNSKTTGEVTVEKANTDHNIVLNNTYVEKPGTLVISKTISGAPLNELETISFSVVDGNGKQLTDADGKAVVVPDLTTANVTAGKWKDSGDGKTFTYKIANLVSGTECTVTETYNEKESSKYSLITSGDDKSTTSDSATIVSGGTVYAEITNNFEEKTTTTKAYIDITKTFGGEVDENDFNNLKFELYKKGDSTPVETFEFNTNTFAENGNTYELINKYEVDADTEYYVKEVNYDIYNDRSVVVTYDLGNTGRPITSADGSSGSFSASTTNVETNPYVVAFTNTYTPYTVNISKRDINQTTGAEVSGAELVVTYVGTDTTVDLSGVTLTRSGKDVTSKATITDKSIKFVSEGAQTSILGLAAGDYTLTETIAPAGYEKQSTTIYFTVGDDGKVTATSTIASNVGLIENNKTVVILDTPTKPGSLVISKTISGADLEDFEKLTFTVVNTKDSTDTIKIPDLTTDNVKNGTWTDKGNGKYTYTVEDLDAGKTYKVTEIYDGTGDSTTYELDTSKSTKEGSATIVAGGSVNVDITDAYTEKTTPVTTGSLVISKTISGADLEDFEKLTFTVVNTKDSTDTIKIPDLTTDNVKNGTWTDKGNGKYTYTVEDLDAGKTYKVTETYDGTGDSTTYELDTSKSTKEGSATIVAGGSVNVDITDAYTEKTTPVTTGSLVISKTISGADLEDFEKLTFTVVNTKDSTDTIKIPDLTTENVKLGVWKNDGNGKYTYTVKNLDADKTYKVTETYDGTGDSTTYELDTSKSTTEGSATIVAGGSVIVTITDTYIETQSGPTPAPVIEKVYIDITKTFGGYVTGEDFDNLTFQIFESGNSTAVATYKFGTDFKETSTSGLYSLKELFEADTSKEYYVVETNYDVNSDKEVSVSYSLDGASNVYGSQTDTFKVTEVDTEEYPFVVAFTNEYMPVSLLKTYGNLTITKSFGPEAPAEAASKNYSFNITGPNGFTDKITITGEDSVSLTDLEPGNYTVTENEETAAINGYDLTVSGDNGVTVEVVAGGDTTCAITNTYVETSLTVPGNTGSLTISKSLGSGSPDAAFANTYKFSVTGPEGYKNTVTITGAGSVTLDDLVPGEYVVTEDESEAGIAGCDLTVSGDNGVKVVVKAGEAATAAITNTYDYGTSVLPVEPDNPTKPTVSPKPTVTVKPTEPVEPTPTTEPEPTEPVEPTPTEPVEPTVPPTPTPVPDSGLELTFEKQDEVGKLIANAVLTLTSADGLDMSDVKVTQNGKEVEFTLSDDLSSISFTTVDTAPSIVSGLQPGNYELKETVTPEGYKTADSIYFVLNDDGSFTEGTSIEVNVAGSPVVMIDEADPTYWRYADINKITDKEHSGSPDKNPNNNPDNSNKDSGNNKSGSSGNTPIPATGEKRSYFAAAGVMLLGLCAAIVTGLGIYRRKKSDN